MSGTNYQSPNFILPYQLPTDTPKSLAPFLAPIYVAFQNMIQTLISSCGIASRSPNQILSSAGDVTAFLANNTHRFYVTAYENITVGAPVSLLVSGGIIMARNANATTSSLPADGFCSQLSGIGIGGIGEVILCNGMNTNLSGLSIGTRYYLSTTAGAYTSTPPTASGNLQQSLGIAVSATSLLFFTGQQVQH